MQLFVTKYMKIFQKPQKQKNLWALPRARAHNKNRLPNSDFIVMQTNNKRADIGKLIN